MYSLQLYHSILILYTTVIYLYFIIQFPAMLHFLRHHILYTVSLLHTTPLSIFHNPTPPLSYRSRSSRHYSNHCLLVTLATRGRCGAIQGPTMWTTLQGFHVCLWYTRREWAYLWYGSECIYDTSRSEYVLLYALGSAPARIQCGYWSPVSYMAFLVSFLCVYCLRLFIVVLFGVKY